MSTTLLCSASGNPFSDEASILAGARSLGTWTAAVSAGVCPTCPLHVPHSPGSTCDVSHSETVTLPSLHRSVYCRWFMKSSIMMRSPVLVSLTTADAEPPSSRAMYDCPAIPAGGADTSLSANDAPPGARTAMVSPTASAEGAGTGAPSAEQSMSNNAAWTQITTAIAAAADMHWRIIRQHYSKKIRTCAMGLGA